MLTENHTESIADKEPILDLEGALARIHLAVISDPNQRLATSYDGRHTFQLDGSNFKKGIEVHIMPIEHIPLSGGIIAAQRIVPSNDLDALDAMVRSYKDKYSHMVENLHTIKYPYEEISLLHNELVDVVGVTLSRYNSGKLLLGKKDNEKLAKVIAFYNAQTSRLKNILSGIDTLQDILGEYDQQIIGLNFTALKKLITTLDKETDITYSSYGAFINNLDTILNLPDVEGDSLREFAYSLPEKFVVTLSRVDPVTGCFHCDVNSNSLDVAARTHANYLKREASKSDNVGFLEDIYLTAQGLLNFLTDKKYKEIISKETMERSQEALQLAQDRYVTLVAKEKSGIRFLTPSEIGTIADACGYDSHHVNALKTNGAIGLVCKPGGKDYTLVACTVLKDSSAYYITPFFGPLSDVHGQEPYEITMRELMRTSFGAPTVSALLPDARTHLFFMSPRKLSMTCAKVTYEGRSPEFNNAYKYRLHTQ